MKKRSQLPDTIDPTTTRYIRQLTGQEEVFAPEPSMSSTPLGVSEKQQRFLKAYSTSGGITKTALRESGTTRSELAEWRANEAFQKAQKETEEEWVEELRKAAFLRATAKSDVLLMFLLKAMKPDVFDDDVRKAQHIGLSANPNNIPVRATLVRDNTINLVSISSEQASELRDILISESSEGPEDP
jgi:predicted ATPase